MRISGIGLSIVRCSRARMRVSKPFLNSVASTPSQREFVMKGTANQYAPTLRVPREWDRRAFRVVSHSEELSIPIEKPATEMTLHSVNECQPNVWDLNVRFVLFECFDSCKCSFPDRLRH